MPWELNDFLDANLVREGLRRINPVDYLDRLSLPIPKDPFLRMANYEATVYMRNQLLRDTDWAGMAHSLEIRTPFVDHLVLEKLASLLRSEISTRGKQALVDSLESPLPISVQEHKKTGFGTPLRQWLEHNKTLADWKEIPSLRASSCPWARRYAYTVYRRYFGK